MKKLLIIDDAGIFLRTMMLTLKDHYSVDVANTTMIADTKISSNRPDLILLDYNMPDMTGAEYLKKLRDSTYTEDIPVFFLTGTDDAKDVKDILSQKPDGYLLKSTPREKLIDYIDDYFLKHRRD